MRLSAPNPTAAPWSTGVDRDPPRAHVDSPSMPRTPFEATGTSPAGLAHLLDRTDKSDMLLLAAVRAILAFATTLIIWITPQEPERFVGITYGSLIAYSIYSAAIVWALSHFRARRLPHRVLPWLDVAFAGYLITLTDGTNSIFFFFFFFAILLAAFTRGFREGMQIAVASAVVFVVGGLVMTPFPAGQDLDRMLIRPICLITFGFLISHWGGRELELKRRLALLRDIGGANYSRGGANAMIEATLSRLRVFFRADSAVLALERGAARTTGTIHTASSDLATTGEASVAASPQTIRVFMNVPERATRWPRKSTLPEWYVPLDTPSLVSANLASEEPVSTLANLLEAKCIAIAGYRQSDGVEGRLVLMRERKSFTDGDAAFLEQCAHALAAMVENITLTEELIDRAAEFERLSISRDLHDTTIQPYIGLRMAIEGAAREFRDIPEVAARLAHLVEMTKFGIEELHAYAMRLKSGSGAGGSLLGTAIERQARRLSRFYGLDVDLYIDPELQPETRIADAIFQMVSEGLSNVVRHTTAKAARVAIRRAEGRCVLEIENPLPDGSPPPQAFVPRSIAERAANLGGRIAVTAAHHKHTIVTVSIPVRFSAP